MNEIGSASDAMQYWWPKTYKMIQHRYTVCIVPYRPYGSGCCNLYCV